MIKFAGIGWGVSMWRLAALGSACQLYHPEGFTEGECYGVLTTGILLLLIQVQASCSLFLHRNSSCGRSASPPSKPGRSGGNGKTW